MWAQLELHHGSEVGCLLTEGETEAQKEKVSGLPGRSRRQLLTELGLFGDLLDVSGGQMFCWEEGRRAIEPNPDLGISGVDRVGCLFGTFGPT